MIEAVFRSDYGRLVALARLLLDRQVEAEEVVQEAFARVLAKRSRGHGPTEASAYVHRRSSTCAATACDADGWPGPSAIPSRGGQARAHWVADGDVAELAAGAERAAGRDRRRSARLPGRQREVVVLRYLAERSTAETAEILGISEGSVKTHLSRGLSALEAELETRP